MSLRTIKRYALLAMSIKDWLDMTNQERLERVELALLNPDLTENEEDREILLETRAILVNAIKHAEYCKRVEEKDRTKLLSFHKRTPETPLRTRRWIYAE